MKAIKQIKQKIGELTIYYIENHLGQNNQQEFNAREKLEFLKGILETLQKWHNDKNTTIYLTKETEKQNYINISNFVMRGNDFIVNVDFHDSHIEDLTNGITIKEYISKFGLEDKIVKLNRMSSNISLSKESDYPVLEELILDIH